MEQGRYHITMPKKLYKRVQPIAKDEYGTFSQYIRTLIHDDLVRRELGEINETSHPNEYDKIEELVQELERNDELILEKLDELQSSLNLVSSGRKADTDISEISNEILELFEEKGEDTKMTIPDIAEELSISIDVSEKAIQDLESQILLKRYNPENTETGETMWGLR